MATEHPIAQNEHLDIKWIDLNTWLMADPARLKEHSLDGFLDEPTMTDGTGIEYFAHCCSSNMLLLLYGIGIELHEDKISIGHLPCSAHTVKERLLAGNVFANMVWSAYENQDQRARDVWSILLGLGGDDDVDYNGSYLNTLFDVVLHYIDAHPDSIVQGIMEQPTRKA